MSKHAPPKQSENELEATKRALFQAQEALKESERKVAELTANERESSEHRQQMEDELKQLRVAAKRGEGGAIFDLLRPGVKGAEIRGVLVQGLPDQSSDRPSYDRVGGTFEVMKLTITTGGIEVEKKRELLDGKAGTEMAWHMGRDHAEKVLEGHVVPEDYR